MHLSSVSPPSPTREEVRRRLLTLLAGRISPREASLWARPWIVAGDPQVDDEAVWEALTCLAMADALRADGDFLYSEIDFHHWLEDLENAP